MSPSPDPSPSHWPARLTQIALGLAIALTITRATIEENVRDREVISPGIVAAPRAAGATSGLVLDLLLCTPALLVLMRRVFDPDFRLRLNISPIIFAAMAMLAAISSAWASDKFAAVVTSAHFVTAAVLLWAMTQLVRTWMDLRLVAAAGFAILLVYAAQGILYRNLEWRDTVRYWEEHRNEVLEQRGYQPGSFAAEQFEKKLLSGELYGFNTSPNTYAAMIVMLGIIGAGAAIQRIINRDEPGWAAGIIVALLMAVYILYFTHCRAAFITPFLAMGMLVVFPRLARWRRRLYFAGAGAVVLVASLIIVQGIAHASLFEKSLTYRWYYWTGAFAILKQHALTGVGWSNFGAYYLGVRLPTATEEIKDPHNLIVRAFVELGIVGGTLMAIWLARVWWELTSPGLPLQWQATSTSPYRNSAFKTLLLICAGAILSNILTSVDYTLKQPDADWYILLEVLKRLLFFVLLLLGSATITLRSSRDPRLDDREAPWILWAILAALAVFLIHNLIDFSLSEPGPMCVFALLAGSALGARSISTQSPGTNRAIIGIVLTISVIGWLAGGIGIVAPVAIAENTAHSANEDLRQGRASAAAAGLQQAFDSLWLPNGDYAYRAAVALALANAPADQVRQTLAQAIDADPMRVEYRRAAADFEAHQPLPDSARLIHNFEQAIALDPSSVPAHRDFADALLRLGQRQQALEEYRTALRYNDLLPADEPKRLPPQQVAEIEQRIRSLGP